MFHIYVIFLIRFLWLKRTFKYVYNTMNWQLTRHWIRWCRWSWRLHNKIQQFENQDTGMTQRSKWIRKDTKGDECSLFFFLIKQNVCFTLVCKRVRSKSNLQTGYCWPEFDGMNLLLIFDTPISLTNFMIVNWKGLNVFSIVLNLQKVIKFEIFKISDLFTVFLFNTYFITFHW